jgi:hypothetical protein
MNNYGIGQSTAGYDRPPDPVAVNENCVSYKINMLENLLGRVASIASHAESVAGAIAGHSKDGEKANPPSPVPNGLVERLSLLEQNLRTHVDRIDMALTRASQGIN